MFGRSMNAGDTGTADSVSTEFPQDLLVQGEPEYPNIH